MNYVQEFILSLEFQFQIIINITFEVKAMKKLWKKIGLEQTSTPNPEPHPSEKNSSFAPQIQNYICQQIAQLNNQLDSFSFDKPYASHEVIVKDYEQPYSFVSDQSEKMDPILVEESEEKIRRFELSEIESFSNLPPEEGRCRHEEKVKRKIEKLFLLSEVIKQMMSTLKKDVEVSKKQIQEEKARFAAIMKEAVKAISQAMEKKSLNQSMMMQGLKKQLQESKKYIHMQTSKYQTVIETMQQTESQNVVEHKKKIREKEEESENQIHFLRLKNASYLDEVKKLKQQKNELNERIFDLEQKMKGFDLQVQKKFTQFVNQYRNIFLYKNLQLKNKISQLSQEISNSNFSKVNHLPTENSEYAFNPKSPRSQFRFSNLQPGSQRQIKISKAKQSLDPNSMRERKQQKLKTFPEQRIYRRAFENVRINHDSLKEEKAANSLKQSICIDEKLMKIKKEIQQQLSALKKM